MKMKSLKLKLEEKKRDRFSLFNGDCVEVLKSIDSCSIDMVLTSPPYDDLRDYHGYSFDFETIAKELSRVLRPGGVIVWVVGDSVFDGSETGTSFRQALYFKDECGLNIHDTMIYQKHGISFPESTRYYQNFEYMFIFSKGKPSAINLIADRKNIAEGRIATSASSRLADGTTKVNRDNGSKVGEIGVRMNVWQLSNGSRGVWSEHPATFPYQLAHDHILSWSRENQTVLDCFMGSGTTGEAAYKLNRNFIGIEISKEFFDLAQGRILGYRKLRSQK